MTTGQTRTNAQTIRADGCNPFACPLYVMYGGLAVAVTLTSLRSGMSHYGFQSIVTRIGTPRPGDLGWKPLWCREVTTVRIVGRLVGAPSRIARRKSL